MAPPYSVCVQPSWLYDAAELPLHAVPTVKHGGSLRLGISVCFVHVLAMCGKRKVLRNNSYSKRRLALSKSVSVIPVTRSPHSHSRRLWRFAGGEKRTLFAGGAHRYHSNPHGFQRHRRGRTLHLYSLWCDLTLRLKRVLKC